MLKSSKESLKQSRSRNKIVLTAPEQAALNQEDLDALKLSGGRLLDFGVLKLQIQLRFLMLVFLILPLYAIAAFVGNDWAYMLPCTLFAALLVGLLLPLLEVLSISANCRLSAQSGALAPEEIVLKAWRKPFLGLLSRLIPSGYLNARLHLMRKGWRRNKQIPAVLPLPVVLESLGRGVEICLKTPALGRGQYEIDSLEVSSCFPFAMVWWTRRIKFSDENRDEPQLKITVPPELNEVQGNFHSRLSESGISSGHRTNRHLYQNKSASLKGLREFTERDSLNQIHWASSARSGKFLVREYENESLNDFDVYIDLLQPFNQAQLDLACTTALALIHYGNRLGFNPSLRLNPPLEWEALAEQMEDIEHGLQAEEFSSQILARLMPMPPDLKNEYRAYEKTQTQSKSALDYLCADSALSHRAIISILPGENREARALFAGITVSELKKDIDNETRVLATLAQLESDRELARI